MAILTPFCINSGALIRSVDASGIISQLVFTSSDPIFLANHGFRTITCLAVDAAGNLYATDSGAAALYKISPSLDVTCLLGRFPAAFTSTGDGGPASQATIRNPSSLTLDTAGNIYLSDTVAAVIRAINMQATPQTLLGQTIQPGCIHAVAGMSGNSGHSGDGGPAIAAQIEGNGNFAALDIAGNLYFSDSFISVENIRRVDHATGIITNAAGTSQGYSGDGGLATAAKLNGPSGMVCDLAGNVYFADAVNHRIRVINRQTTTQTFFGIAVGAGCIQTVAGNGAAGYNGDGIPAATASLHGCNAVALDGAGNLYISDPQNNRIRLVDALTNLISTVAGNGISGNIGNGGPATSAEISLITAVAVFFVPVGPSVKERRFACNGAFESSSAYGDVLKSLALSMAGFVVPPGDCWRVYAGSFVPPEVTLADADCRSSIKGEFRLSARDTCNGVKGQYIPAFLPINPLGPLSASPASAAWKKTDFPPVQRANYIAEDGGRILWKDIQLDFTISLWMAQRIGRIVLERLRRQITISLPAKLTGVALLAADTMQFLHPRWGTVTPPVPTTFQVAHTSLRVEAQADGVPAFGTDLILRETDEKVYEFAEPTSPTNFGDYSGYGQTGIGAGNVQ